MDKCFVKYCIPLIFLGMLAFFIMLVNFKPDLLKSNFDSFIDMLTFKKSTKIDRETYIKKESRYKEPSAFEQNQ